MSKELDTPQGMTMQMRMKTEDRGPMTGYLLAWPVSGLPSPVYFQGGLEEFPVCQSSESLIN